MSLETTFLNYSAGKLRQCADRIGVCLDKLTSEQVWARGSENENAIGNLVIHLAGNIGQWIGNGVMGRPLTRDRDAEFDARGGMDPAALKAHLRAVVDRAIVDIVSLAPERLSEAISVQGYAVTVLEAIYHVVEHFSGHTGQVIFATKLCTGDDLGFYAHLKKPAHAEPTP